MRKTILFLLFLLFISIIRAQDINHWEMIISADDIWNYYPATAEPASDWADIGFNTSGWLVGPGGIGYGDGDDATVIAPTISLYIRRDFNVSDPSLLSWFVLHVDFDDAFVAYLNGHEIARANIGVSGVRPPYDQSANNADYEAQIPLGGIPARFMINKDTIAKYIATGTNTLALQVHNAGISSSDLSSTTFLMTGVKTSAILYRATPSWFVNPLSAGSDLPLIVIDTWGNAIPDDPKITAWMKVIDNGPGSPNNILDSGTDYEGYIGIETRGQSSQMFPKKSYGLETRDAMGTGIDTVLLGMPSEEDWILHGPYSDKSLMRNALTYQLGQSLGTWQPRFRFCELYINGNYNGIYMLVEKIKRDSSRVDVARLNPTEITGDDLTGGYIVKVDKTWDLTTNEYFQTFPVNRYQNARTYKFTYVYPDYDVIVPEQKQYIYNYLLTLENTLNGPLFTDLNNGFRKYMDVASFVDFQIIQELSNNVDGYRYSTFFHKRKDSDGGKLLAGPIWDFDLCYGNVDYSPINLATEGWLFTNYGPNEGYAMHWWARLMEDAGYRDALSTRYWELRKKSLSTDSIFRYIDNSVTYLGPAVARNFTKWPILGVYVWPNYYVGSSHASEVTYLKSWINNRLIWMDANIPRPIVVEDTTFPPQGITVYPNPATTYLNVAVKSENFDVISIEIIDITGRMVLQDSYYPHEKGLQKIEIDLPSMARGYYIVRCHQGNRELGSAKLVISGR